MYNKYGYMCITKLTLCLMRFFLQVEAYREMVYHPNESY